MCGRDEAGDAGPGPRLDSSGGGTLELIFTDPPYGKSYRSLGQGRRGIRNDDLKGDALGRLVKGAMLPAKWRYVCAEWACFSTFEKALGKPQAVCVWVKNSLGLGAGYRHQHEVAMVYVPDHIEVLTYGRLKTKRADLSDVWRFERAEAYEHPTQKPVAIVVKALADTGASLVYDPFLGSGTTLIAAEQLGRRACGVELDPAFADVAVRRWELYSGRKAKKLKEPKLPVA